MKNWSEPKTNWVHDKVSRYGKPPSEKLWRNSSKFQFLTEAWWPRPAENRVSSNVVKILQMTGQRKLISRLLGGTKQGAVGTGFVGNKIFPWATQISFSFSAFQGEYGDGGNTGRGWLKNISKKWKVGWEFSRSGCSLEIRMNAHKISRQDILSKGIASGYSRTVPGLGWRSFASATNRQSDFREVTSSLLVLVYVSSLVTRS